MVRDVTLEPLFPTHDIQGDILVGLPKLVERMLFFTIDDPGDFKKFLNALQVTSMAECLTTRDLIAQCKAAGIHTVVPAPGLNIAFTYTGLKRLGVPGLDEAAGLDELRDGMATRTGNGRLVDPPALEWAILRPDPLLHGVLILTGASEAEIADIIALRLAPVPGNGWHILHEEVGQVRPDPVKGHEHFGYADGVSQPGVRGRVAPGAALNPTSPDTPAGKDQAEPGQDLLWPGEFLFGYPGQDPSAPDFTVRGEIVQPPVPFMANGSYLVFRRLLQLVPEFDNGVKAAAAASGGVSENASAEMLGAQLVGRWKSGTPIIKAPIADDPKLAEGTVFVNDFEFGADREGLTCPWAAHIRKAYPRDDAPDNLAPTEAQTNSAKAFTQAHRMLRRGIAFGPELTEHEALSGHSDPGHARGLLFRCYVTSIEDQFEFVQQAWVNSEGFAQPGSGIDAIIGQSPTDPAPFLGAAPTTRDPAKKPQLHFARFVVMQGGEYFFAPAISALRGL